MWYLLLVGIIFFMLGIIIKLSKDEKLQSITGKKNSLEKYTTKDYIMTETELRFFKLLKNELKKQNLNYNIFPQVDLERIIQIKDNNNADRNRIKSRSIDYTITNDTNCKIIACIELDDYTHNKTKRIERDNFINNIFKQVNIKLLRIPVSNYYNINEIIENIKGVN